jgi:hypothetical protein
VSGKRDDYSVALFLESDSAGVDFEHVEQVCVEAGVLCIHWRGDGRQCVHHYPMRRVAYWVEYFEDEK